MDFLLNLMRELAKSNRYQTLYIQAKEMDIRLFENNVDLTDLQIKFLNLLTFYSNLYMDLAMGDVDERVFKSNIREDAYHLYKIKTMHKSFKEETNTTQTPRPMKKIDKGVQRVTQKLDSEWVFKKPK